MTRREYYDLLVKTSLAGGFPAGNVTAGCAMVCQYRAADGRKCAVGLLIPDAEYTPRLEAAGSINNILDSYGFHDVADHTATINKDWNHADFVAQLNRLPFFAEFATTTPTEVPS